jgi:hypothetical protein
MEMEFNFKLSYKNHKLVYLMKIKNNFFRGVFISKFDNF